MPIGWGKHHSSFGKFHHPERAGHCTLSPRTSTGWLVICIAYAC